MITAQEVRNIMGEKLPIFKKNLINGTLDLIEKEIIDKANKGKSSHYIFLSGTIFNDFQTAWIKEMLKVIEDKGFRLDRKGSDLVICWDN